MSTFEEIPAAEVLAAPWLPKAPEDEKHIQDALETFTQSLQKVLLSKKRKCIPEKVAMHLLPDHLSLFLRNEDETWKTPQLSFAAEINMNLPADATLTGKRIKHSSMVYPYRIVSNALNDMDDDIDRCLLGTEVINVYLNTFREVFSEWQTGESTDEMFTLETETLPCVVYDICPALRNLYEKIIKREL